MAKESYNFGVDTEAKRLYTETRGMSDKRFTLEEFGLNFIVNDNGRNLTAKQTVDRLNELNDENEQLKKELDKLELVNEMLSMDFSNSEHELWKENEQLKELLKQSVFVNIDGEEGCWNCKHCYGGFCEILEKPIVSWLKGVSDCNLKTWEFNEE